MQQSILFKVPGKPSTSPIVILTGPALGALYSTPASVRLSRALSMVWSAVKCSCTPRRITTVISSLCAFMAIFFGLESSVSQSQVSQIIMAMSTCIGLPVTMIGAFLSGTNREGGAR